MDPAPPAGPVVRRATADDLPAVGALTPAAYAPFLEPEDPYADRLRDARRRHEEAELWVAVDPDGPLVGTVTTCPPGSPWRERAVEGEGEFRMLAVAPSAQGRGIGELLLRHVLGLFTDRAYDGVVLSSLDRMHTAHRLYARHGFVRDPGRDWTPTPGVHLLVFVRRL
ncbi:GNAT family N-acetyltransferase [Nocardioidaceae bacterium]|nr:GNAT family N-acetyltransferase [Nocardioidaceae bacterium]